MKVGVYRRKTDESPRDRHRRKLETRHAQAARTSPTEPRYEPGYYKAVPLATRRETLARDIRAKQESVSENVRTVLRVPRESKEKGYRHAQPGARVRYKHSGPDKHRESTMVRDTGVRVSDRGALNRTVAEHVRKATAKDRHDARKYGVIGKGPTPNTPKYTVVKPPTRDDARQSDLDPNQLQCRRGKAFKRR